MIPVHIQYSSQLLNRTALLAYLPDVSYFQKAEKNLKVGKLSKGTETVYGMPHLKLVSILNKFAASGVSVLKPKK